MRGLETLRAQCVNPSDSLFEQMSSAAETVKAVLEVADRPADAVEALEQGAKVDFSGTAGSSAKNWSAPITEIRKQFREEIGQPFQIAVRVRPSPDDPALPPAEFRLDYVAQRKAEGVATFDDLLVWARDLLRDDAPTRRRFQERYTHILIDEFQDTDPLQAEIAFYLAATSDANIAGLNWHTIPLIPGKLFIVGDSKQSIYRFRRADIGGHPVGERERPAAPADAGRKPPFTATDTGLGERRIRRVDGRGGGPASRIYRPAAQRGTPAG